MMESALRITRSAMALSLAHGQTLYDCLYLALALDQQCELVTADRAFYAGVHVAFPVVGLLEGA
jgi:predicted nucleic acid-binding protein